MKGDSRILDFNDSGLARLYVLRTHSNIFLTITDMRNVVLKAATSGNSGVGPSKRLKKAPLALESIVRNCLSTFEYYNIRMVEIVMKTKISAFYYTLLRELKFHGISIEGTVVRRKRAFNGVRKRKLRRR